jgi:predicted phage-related endonuclease
MIDHELRRTRITSTDLGPIFGVDEWRDAFSVWAEKKGRLPAREPTPRMRMGKFLERGIVAAYGAVTRREPVWCDETVCHPERDWMAASPDALCAGERRGVDAKLVFWDQRRKWGATPDDIPESIQVQMWWMMAVLEYDVWDVAALVGDDLPRVYTFERDREIERALIAKAEEFWRRHILGDEVPAIGGSAAAGVWLQQAFPTHRRPDLRAATAEEIADLEQCVQVRIEQRVLAEERACLENRLKLAVGEREGLYWPEGKFTWRKTRDQTVTDWESMATGLLHAHVKDAEERETLTGIYRTTKPGPRRVLLESDLLRRRHETEEEEDDGNRTGIAICR